MAAFEDIATEYSGALQRLARGYEADPDRQHDLVQEMLLALWKSLPAFEGRSSLRTWVYRLAHNVAASHVVRRSRDRLARSIAIDDADLETATRDAIAEAEGRDHVAKLAALVRAMKPADAQIIVLYLEGLDHAEIAEVTGLTANNVAVKVSRIKTALKRAFEGKETRP